MTANGDGLNFDFLNEPSPGKKPSLPDNAPVAESPPTESEFAGVLDDDCFGSDYRLISILPGRSEKSC